MERNSPLNMKERDIIKALNNIPLHLVDHCCVLRHTETQLGCSPVLLDKVELAVILGVKIADVTIRLNQLLKLGLL